MKKSRKYFKGKFQPNVLQLVGSDKANTAKSLVLYGTNQARAPSKALSHSRRPSSSQLPSSAPAPLMGA